MARVTSKFQVTIPRQIARRYHIEPGVDILWLPAGDAIRIVVPGAPSHRPDRERRLELFDQATDRQRERSRGTTPEPVAGRGWTRDELYGRGRAD